MWKDIAVGNKTDRFALIDADGILYAAALEGQVMVDGKAHQMTTVDYIYGRAVERIEDQMSWAEAEEGFIVLSDRRNFRHDILPSYKGQRKATDRPLLLDGLRAMMVEKAPYRVQLIKGLEADDVCGISAGALQRAGKVTVIVSPDKDLLQIPGLVLSIGRSRQRALIEVTQEMADWQHRMQTLTGDTTDNYKGCPGIGAAKAERLLASLAGACPEDIWAAIVKCFVKVGLTEADCLVQARVSRILRVTDWDAEAKEPILFELPKP